MQIEQLRLLPADGSLSAEVGWVQANRLRIVKEKASGAIRVHQDHLRPVQSSTSIGRSSAPGIVPAPPGGQLGPL